MSTSASGAGTLRVTVNGTDIGAKAVAPGRATRWFVPESLLQAGVTNVLQVTRTDAGSTPVNIDVAYFGGSLQYGERDNSHYEFSVEGRYQSGKQNIYPLIGANWFDGARAIFGSNGSSAYTNTVITFVNHNLDRHAQFPRAVAGSNSRCETCCSAPDDGDFFHVFVHKAIIRLHRASQPTKKGLSFLAIARAQRPSDTCPE